MNHKYRASSSLLSLQNRIIFLFLELTSKFSIVAANDLSLSSAYFISPTVDCPIQKSQAILSCISVFDLPSNDRDETVFAQNFSLSLNCAALPLELELAISTHPCCC